MITCIPVIMILISYMYQLMNKTYWLYIDVSALGINSILYLYDMVNNLRAYLLNIV
jgi:hypothetical protein